MQSEKNPCTTCFWWKFKDEETMEPNYLQEPPACVAFPDGIPEEIFDGQDPHTKVHPDQDNEIVYKKFVI